MGEKYKMADKKPTILKDPVKLNIPTTDEVNKGALVPFDQSEIQKNKRGLKSLLRKAHPILRGIDTISVLKELVQPQSSYVSDTLETDKSRSGLETIIDFVKGKNPPVSRRDFLQGIKRAGQMAATPNLPFKFDPKEDTLETEEKEKLSTAAADKVFNLWKKPSAEIFRNIYFTGDSRKAPSEAYSMDRLQDFRDEWTEGIWQMADLGSIDEAKDFIENTPSDLIRTTASGTNLLASKEWRRTWNKVFNDEFIRSLKDEGISEDEIYDLWKLGAKRYLDNYFEETTGFYPLDEDDDWTKRSGGVIRNPYSYAPRDI